MTSDTTRSDEAITEFTATAGLSVAPEHRGGLLLRRGDGATFRVEAFAAEGAWHLRVVAHRREETQTLSTVTIPSVPGHVALTVRFTARLADGLIGLQAEVDDSGPIDLGGVRARSDIGTDLGAGGTALFPLSAAPYLD